MFQVNRKQQNDILVYFNVNFEHIFYLYFSVSIVDSEQVNISLHTPSFKSC